MRFNNVQVITISSENSSAHIAYFPGNCFFASEIDGPDLLSSAVGNFASRSSLSAVSLTFRKIHIRLHRLISLLLYIVTMECINDFTCSLYQ